MEEIGLSKTESLSFLEDVLKIPVEDFKPDLSSLNNIIRRFMEIIPFQSIFLIAQDFKDRHVPTWPEVKAAIFKKHGGICQVMNGFMFFLLKSLSYDVMLGAATVTLVPETFLDDHVIVYVQNLRNPKDLFLIDVAFGSPAFEAVNLDFERESRVYKNSYLEYKFFKSDGKIIRAHGKGDIRFEKEVEPWEIVFGKWRSAYWCDPKDLRPFSEFASFYEYTYTHMNIFPFHTSLRSVSFPQGKMFAILDESTLTETSDGHVEKNHISGDDELIRTYCKHFPQFEETLIRKAVKIWREQRKNKHFASRSGMMNT